MGGAEDALRSNFTDQQVAEYVLGMPDNEVERALKRREPGFSPPVSDETGGPLSGAEAERVLTGKSIRFLGYLWEGGQVVCKPCSRALVAQPPGWRFVLYEGDNVRGFRCMTCRGVIER